MLTTGAGLDGGKTRHLASPDATWVRPADWLALPAVNVGDNTLVGLHAVFPHGSNFVALQCAGNYVVDWGDGSAPQSVSANTNAEHNYVFGDLSAGTATSEGFRQAIVTITMQAGQTFTKADLYKKHSATPLPNEYAAGWLDLRIAGSSISTLVISGSTVLAPPYMLAQFEYVGPSSLTTVANLFTNCVSLKTVIGTAWTSAVTSFSAMFNTCRSLRGAPPLDTHSALNVSSMFQACSSLRSVPTLDTSQVTNFTSMFSGCSCLRFAPRLDTSKGTSFSSMFSNCASLQVAPDLDTHLGTTFASMFATCSSLRAAPALNTGSGLTFTNMFATCYALTSIPTFDTSKGVGFSGMFTGCQDLRTIPLLDTHLGTTFANMFSGCSSLETVPALVVSAANAGNLTGMFDSCPTLASAALSGTAQNISYSGCRLSAAELDAIYTALGTGTGKTITVTNNWGTASDTPSIATGKGWTVVGS